MPEASSARAKSREGDVGDALVGAQAMRVAAGVISVEAEGAQVIDGRACVDVGTPTAMRSNVAIKIFNGADENLELLSPPFVSNTRFNLLYPPAEPWTLYLGGHSDDSTLILVQFPQDDRPEACEITFHGRLRPSLARGEGSFFIVKNGALPPVDGHA